MGNLVLVAVAAVMTLVFLAFLLFFFSYVRLWIQALLANTPVSIIDILRMKLRNCPPELIVQAMIALRQRGVRVPVREVEGYYLASAASGERITTAAELADLVEDVKRENPTPPQT